MRLTMDLNVIDFRSRETGVDTDDTGTQFTAREQQGDKCATIFVDDQNPVTGSDAKLGE